MIPIDEVGGSSDADRQRFLAWIDFNATRAEQTCDSVFQRLIYVLRGWFPEAAEDLASETLMRTLAKFARGGYLDDREAGRYIHEVAKRVRLEYAKRRKSSQLDERYDVADPRPPVTDDLESWEAARDLSAVLDQLRPEDRAFILRYYRDDSPEERTQLAAELNITTNAMRVRAISIRRRILGHFERKAHQTGRAR